MTLVRRFLAWVVSLFGKGSPALPDEPVYRNKIVPILVYPRELEREPVGEEVAAGEARYYLSWPIRLPEDRIEAALGVAKSWLDSALAASIPWEPLKRLDSGLSLAQWRANGIGLLRQEVESASMPWTEDRIYLAFVRGMGGYAGGIKYEEGAAGYAMVGDVCLEAICYLEEPNAASALLGEAWPDSSRSAQGQTAAFIHEALHGLDLPHPDGWPDGEQPGWSETIMGYWWNMPNFSNSSGLTNREIQRVLKWLQ